MVINPIIATLPCNILSFQNISARKNRFVVIQFPEFSVKIIQSVRRKDNIIRKIHYVFALGIAGPYFKALDGLCFRIYEMAVFRKLKLGYFISHKDHLKRNLISSQRFICLHPKLGSHRRAK